MPGSFADDLLRLLLLPAVVADGDAVDVTAE